MGKFTIEYNGVIHEYKSVEDIMNAIDTLNEKGTKGVSVLIDGGSSEGVHISRLEAE